MAGIFITGAGGYLGECVAVLASKAGHQVKTLAGRLADLSQRSVRADYVLHLAAALRPKTDAELTKTNVHGTAALLQAVTGSPKVVFVSSRAVYGTAYPPLVAGENTLPAPADAYGETKRAAEELVSGSSLEHIVFRPSVLYGYGLNKAGDSFVTRMAKSAVTQGRIVVDGDDPLADAVHVWDMAKIIVDCCSPGDHWGLTYNVAGPRKRISQTAAHLRDLARGLGFSCTVGFDAPRKTPGVLLDTDRYASYFALELRPPEPQSLERLMSEIARQTRPTP